MDPLTIVFLVGGLVLLAIGGEALVRGASRLAVAAGMSPLVVGLTVVAFGTSAPEAAVAVQASAGGQSDIAIGNVIGSNIFNVLFVLGISAALAPLVVAQQLVRLDVPIMIGASILVLVLALDGEISRLDGMLLLGAIGVYTVFVVVESRREHVLTVAEYGGGSMAVPAEARSARAWIVNVTLVLLGLGLLVVGARWLVDAAVAIATLMGVSQLVIGLTIVAAGTSLPEVATAIIATARGERDIAVGNAVGSNIFNLLFVLGLSSLVAPDGIPTPAPVRHFDLPIMIAVAVACLPIFFTGHRIDRWEGLLFLAYYVAYALFLILEATAHDALPAYSEIMLQFLLPLTVITLLVLFVRSARQRAWEARHSGGLRQPPDHADDRPGRD